MHNHHRIGNSFTYILFKDDPVMGLPTREDLVNLLETDHFYTESYEDLVINDQHDAAAAIALLYCDVVQPDRNAESSINQLHEIKLVVLAPYWVPYSSFLRLKFSQGLVCGMRMTCDEADEIFEMRMRLACVDDIQLSFERAIKTLMYDSERLRDYGLFDPVVASVDWGDLLALTDSYGHEAFVTTHKDILKFMNGRVWEDNPRPARPLPLSQFFEFSDRGQSDPSA